MAAKKHSILIVDDEQDILDTLMDTFHEHYNVFQADNARDALQILENNEIDIIISDQRMPEMTGVEMFSQIDSKYPHVGKVLLSGYSDNKALEDAINKGSIDKFLSKPWKENELLEIALEVINARFHKLLEERKAVESQLFQTAKLASIGELTAGIAHELNNPLGYIDSNLGNLQKFVGRIVALVEAYSHVQLPPETAEEFRRLKEEIKYEYIRGRAEEMIERSRVGAERMKKIIVDLKTFSRREDSQNSEADINEAIETTLSLLKNEYKYNIEIIRDYGDLPLVICNISKLNQVFMNLMINACHAIEGEGEIRIKTAMESNGVRIDISDTGKGMPEELLQRIFEPFFTTKPVGKGTGLGLSISRRIISEHNGELSVRSAEGEGTTFTIKIPRQ